MESIRVYEDSINEIKKYDETLRDMYKIGQRHNCIVGEGAFLEIQIGSVKRIMNCAATIVENAKTFLQQAAGQQ